MRGPLIFLKEFGLSETDPSVCNTCYARIHGAQWASFTKESSDALKCSHSEKIIQAMKAGDLAFPVVRFKTDIDDSAVS